MTTDITPAEFSISSSLLEHLKKEGTIKTFPPDTVLIDENDYIRFVPIVLTGAIKVIKLDEEGREMLLYYIAPGESCVMSFLGATCNGTSKIKAVVEEEAEVLLLPIHKVSELIRENPQWIQFMFDLYNKRYEELLSVVNAIAFQKVDVRLWELLKTKVKMLKTNELTMTHQQIADELGTAREVVSRLLKQLERDKKISLGRNKIKILAPM
ncbi:MAG TPA: Crp/Fnr family transcriptional regulator [Cyclobacteriaceae bacterium]|jgi:CRP/FNR family transcriptional regulator|nr:Crp/Fnr family transcriptional regulator [Cyclobacteriaceae bacterium]PZN57327.1 MAG: Crp/Fnr family transcriptional regulator [Bacteroidota bacterium]